MSVEDEPTGQKYAIEKYGPMVLSEAMTIIMNRDQYIAELESLLVDIYTLGTWHDGVDERLDRAVQRIVGDKQ